jgi:hypothetical protein
MKAIRPFIIVIVLSVLCFSIHNNSIAQSRMKEGFYIGAFNFFPWNCANPSWYSELKLRSMQDYTSHGDWDSELGGFFTRIDTVNSYKIRINNFINIWNNTASGRNSFMMEREKVLRSAYGQRSTYEVEDNTIMISGKQGYGYVNTDFPNSNETDATHGNVRVKHCIPPHTPGNIACTLFENREQANNVWSEEVNNSGARLFSDIKNPSYNYRWFIKPRMRIDPVYAQQHPNEVVVILKVRNFCNEEILNLPIKCLNFIDDNNNYDGRYLEMYNDLPLGEISQSVSASDLARGTVTDEFGRITNITSSRVDYILEWQGTVEVWVDYVRVDDEWAHFLFTDPDGLSTNNDWHFYQRIYDEVDEFSQKPGFGYFYMDEFAYNNIPCMAEVNRIVKARSGNTTALIPCCCMTVISEWGGLRNWPSEETLLEYLYTSGAVRDIFLEDIYPIMMNFKIPPNIVKPDPGVYPGTQRMSNASSYDDYNSYLNSNVHDTLFLGLRKKTADMTKAHGIIYNTALQVHDDEQYLAQWPENGWALREPFPEEIKMQMYLGLVYGSKQLFQYSYHTQDFNNNLYSFGMMNTQNNGKRLKTYYKNPGGNELIDKWNAVVNINTDVQNVGDFMYPANQPNQHLIWQNTITVNPVINPYLQHLPFLYIENIQSLDPHINGINPCSDYNPELYEYYDCPDYRYWEIGLFTPNPNSGESQYTKYFIPVNKRCAPYFDANNPGDKRYLKIKFNPNFLPGPVNWKITNAITGNELVTFNKNTANFINISEIFQPGEGKLFKLSPVITSGGELACDETINSDVTIGGMIDGNGHNFIINEGKTVTFKQDAGIEMNGGVFICGINSDNADAVTLKGEGNSNIWKGLILNNCDSVGIYNTNITNIKANDTAKAVLLTNCYKSEFRKNTITANNNSGGIQAVYNTETNDPIIFKIRECNFYMNQSGYSAINVISNASVTLPLNIEWCIFNAGNDTSNAVMLSEVTGGVIKNNLFSNFGKSAVFMLSTVDLYGNVILGRNSSQGIQCLAGSSISLSPVSGMYLGGYNYIRNYGSSASNIYSDNSMFYINNGQNDFDLDDTTDSKHLTGNISGFPLQYVNAMKNCFHKDSVSNITATSSVIWNSTSDPVNFIFTDYSCELTPPGDFFVFQYDNYNDTVYRTQGGEGGGLKSKAIDLKEEENKSNELEITPSNIFEGLEAKKALSPFNIEENNYKALRDSVNINLRKRNYAVVEQKAMQILSQYPDSSASTGMIPKLYVAVLNLDTNEVKTGQLKSFLENLITNNTQNTGLVKSAFYHIQKCKVKLGAYQSALDGFQYIMTQNPYSYEGLIASWDYAATYLLMGSGGISGNENISTEEELNTPADTLINRMLNRDINSDKNTERNKTSFNQNRQQTGVSNEQSRKDFYEKIKLVNNDSKTMQEEKVKTLEKKIETARDDKTKEEAKTELTKMKQINEAVKIKKPDNIKTHTIIINNDIRKVFGIGKKSKKETSTSTLPNTFELYQNYPNPFNPATKIAFDLPKDAKVKLVIYDILGREMKTLINNEFRTAGKYISEFNGSQLASGVYFARILVNDGKEFVAVKKMVLVK